MGMYVCKMVGQANTENKSWDKKVLVVILLSILIKIFPAWVLCFGNDEVYYWTYSRQLQWNYFDHPPMVALLVKIFSFDPKIPSEGLIRTGSMLCSALSTWIVYKMLSAMHSQSAGFYAVVLVSVSFYTAIIAGFLIMPDTTQVLFWSASLFYFLKILKSPDQTLNWVFAGLLSGLCIMSKVHGIFLPAGLTLFMLVFNRRWFFIAGFWFYVLLVALISCPIFFWNLQNDFITFRFHSDRVIIHQLQINWLGFLREIVGEILYNNPSNFLLICLSIVALWKRKVSLDPNKKIAPLEPYKQLLLCISLPMISVLLLLALFRDTLPHWSGPAYLTLIPLAAVYLASNPNFKIGRNWMYASSCLFVGAFLILFSIIEWYPGTLGSKNNTSYGQGDITLDMYGWKDAGRQFKEFIELRQKNNLSGDPQVLVNSKWFPAAHEDFYFCQPTNKKMVGLGTLTNLHYYYWLNALLPKNINMSSAYCLIPSNIPCKPLEEYGAYYTMADSLTQFKVMRGSKISRYFTVYLLKGWKSKIPVWDGPSK